MSVHAPAYRLYVDEAGDPSFAHCERLDRRFLSLTGVACALADVRGSISPELTWLKERHFDAHPDDERPLVLHRRDIVHRRGPYGVLLDPDRAGAFDADLFDAFSRWPYIVFTAVLDKHVFQQQVPTGRPEVYAHLLGALVERYVWWMREQQARGDVMVESCGGREDMALKTAFRTLQEAGGFGTTAGLWGAVLTSVELKVRQKRDNIAGFQLADLLAHPSAGALQARHGLGARPVDFGGRVVDLLDLNKYARLSDGQVENVGCLWLPNTALIG